MKRKGDRAVTILLPLFLVLAGGIVVGFIFVDYAFPCEFNLCTGVVQVVTLSSATLYHGYSATASSGGTASLSVSLNNPGSTTYISSLILSGGNTTAASTVITFSYGTQVEILTTTVYSTINGTNWTITKWENSTNPIISKNFVNFNESQPGNNRLSANGVSSFTFYPFDNRREIIALGATYNYVINFQNGQSVSGSLIAQ